jgi:hypothetical protein
MVPYSNEVVATGKQLSKLDTVTRTSYGAAAVG